MEFHPVASIFPMMSAEEFAALKESIQARGLRVPVYTHENKIVDGRNRYKACLEIGINPRFEQWDGKGLLVDFVWDLNAQRRQLTGGALHIAAGKYAIEHAAEARLRQGSRTDLTSCSNEHEVEFGRSADKAAGKFNLGRATVVRAVRVVKHGAPELVQAVESGHTTVTAAAKVATLPIEEQKQIVACGEDEIVKVASDIRGHKANGAGKNIPQKPQEKEDKEEIKLQGVGVYRAHEAINCLKRIPKNDALRKRGFQIVTDWIRHNQ